MLGLIWWLFFWTAIGLCVGSFLNVVIYRIPRNQSLRDPVWSACPQCGTRIAWYDNLPVVSFVRLGGKCRHCRGTISAGYPLVELLTALVVIVLFDAFFVTHTRQGLFNQPFLTWALSRDWPIFLAHVVLFACLLAMSAIDLKEYWLDIRFTTFATWVGFALHAIWTPRHSADWLRPGEATAMGSLGAMLGLAGLWFWLRYRPRHHAEWSGEPIPDEAAEAMGDQADDAVGGEGETQCQAMSSTDEPQEVLPEPVASGQAGGWAGAGLVGVVFAVVLASLVLERADLPVWLPGPWRSLVLAGLVFVLVLWESRLPKGADQEIIEAIEAERFSARRMVLGELGLLVPAIVLGGIGAWLMMKDAAMAERLEAVLHWRAGQEWKPVYGLATAASGYVIGGGIGWAVRIVFTLAFGKEAFGMGDIHMMAAAGCVAGWPVVLLGFFVTVMTALAAWLISLPFKRTRAIPLVPWLAFGYLIVVVHYESLLRFGPIRNALEVIRVLILNNSQAGSIGMAL